MAIRELLGNLRYNLITQPWRGVNCLVGHHAWRGHRFSTHVELHCRYCRRIEVRERAGGD